MNINLTTERMSMKTSSRKIAYQINIDSRWGKVSIARRIYRAKGGK
jgi:hypothetical protein